MEILESYDFTRPSRSQYAPAVEALCHPDPNKRASIVSLKRAEDFSEKADIRGVQGAVSDRMRKALEKVPDLRGRRPRTFIESNDVIVISLWPEGEEPRRRTGRRRERQAATA
jgi:hypothetical protein